MGFFGDSPPPEVVSEIQRYVKFAFTTGSDQDASILKLLTFCQRGYIEEVLEELRPRFKYASEKSQIQFINVVDILISNAGSRFAALVSTDKWTERFFRVAKTSTNQVRDLIFTKVHEWGTKKKVWGFNKLEERFHRSQVLGEPFSKIVNEGSKDAGPFVQDFDHQAEANRNQLLNDEETFLLQAQGDLASLEYWIQIPNSNPDDSVAKECKHHKKQCMRMLESGRHEHIEGELINLIQLLSDALELYEAVTGKDLGEGAASRARAKKSKVTKAESDSDEDAYVARLQMKGIKKVDTGAVMVEAQKATGALMDKEREEATKLRDKLAALEKKHEELELKYKEAKVKNKAALVKLKELDSQANAQALVLAATATGAAGAAKKDKVSAASVEKMANTASKMRSNLLTIRQGLRDLKTRVAADIVKESQFYAAKITNAVAALAEAGDVDREEDKRALKWTQELYKKEMQLRKQYYNQIQELKGNIRVYCRVRPMLQSETQAGHKNALSYPTEDEIQFVDASGRPKNYEFDQVYQPTASQAKVFEDTAPLIDSVVDGYNVCIFAYGQTGSGKTFTMGGGANEDQGINTRALERLFSIIKSREETERSTVSVSVLEIYCEQIRDLLGKNSSETYEVKQGGPYGTYVTNLTETEVTNAGEITGILAKAQTNRSQGRTNMNEHSSRSHMLLYIIVKTTNIQTGLKSYGKLSLIDLAGSERLDKSGAVGQQQREAVSINKSLSALGDVISGLSQSQKHVPFRNSVLTFLLQDSMAGQAKVLMFVCVGPANYNVSETSSSLQFASRARGVAFGQIKKNEAVK